MSVQCEVKYLCQNRLCNKSAINKNQEKDDILDKYTWAQRYKCANCQAVYFSCRLCNEDETNKSLLYRSRLSRHHQIHLHNEIIVHRRKRVKSDIAIMPTCYREDCTNDEIFPVVEDMKSDIQGSDNGIKSDVLIEDMYDRNETYNYMNNNISVERPYDGPSYLVGRAITNTNNLHQKMDENDIMLHLLMAKFVTKLSKNQRLQFALIMKLLMKKYGSCKKDETTKSRDNEHTNSILVTVIPTSDSEFRKVYMTGQSSIWKNLPRPKVSMVDDHSYVSIRQCIIQFLANGKMPQRVSKEKGNNVTSLSDSNVRKEVYERAVKANLHVSTDNLIVLMGISWSDDFDPNSSIKANRGAVWIRTVTFISETFTDNTLEDTYTISIGLKNQCHDAIERDFVTELEELKNGKNNIFFSMNRKQYVTVHFEVIAFLGDQPERRGINYIMLGNSIFGARYTYSANISAISEYLPMCSSCTERCQSDKNHFVNSKKCGKCLQWNIVDKHKLNRFEPPKHYPKDMIPLDGKLEPVKLSFEMFKFAVGFATDKYLHGSWNERCVQSYLSSLSINTNGQGQTIDHCHKMKALMYVKENESANKVMKDLIISDFETNPHRYEKWTGGVYWNSSIGLDDFCDVIMHLIFLGITKASKGLLFTWVNEKMPGKTYDKLSKVMLSSISDLGLDWCKVIVSDCGWVSENYLAYARLVKWIYHPLSTLYHNKNANEPYVEPLIPVHHWYRKMCLDWLYAHGLAFKGTLSELRAIIKMKKSNTDSPPKLEVRKSCEIDIVDSFIGSLLSTIACVMTRVVNEEKIVQVEREIKIYLTNLDKFEVGINTEQKKTKHAIQNKIWLKKYNFLSLLNIPDIMQKYGPLINLWEGSNQGEGYLRYAKPRIRDIHSHNWQINAHTNLLNESSMKDVIKCHIYHNTSHHHKEDYVKYEKSNLRGRQKMFQTYQSIYEVFSLYRRNKPLSIIRVQNGNFYIVIAQGEKESLSAIKVMFKYNLFIPTLSMHFHEMIIDVSKTQYDLIGLTRSDISCYILALPKADVNGFINVECNALYYIIDSNWNELSEEMDFISPRSPGCKY